MAFSDDEADDWSACGINKQSPAPVAWDAATLDLYLRNVAIAHATGKRLRDLPLSRKRIKDAIDA